MKGHLKLHHQQGAAKAAILIVVLAIAAGAAWFFVSPLFIDEAVDEAFPVSLPSPGEVAAMEPEARQALMDEVMADMAAMPDKEMAEPMPEQDSPVVIKSGSFRDADAVHKGSGRAKIYQLADDRQLLRLEDFNVTNGPALVVYLARHPNPTRAADVKLGFYSLGELKGNIGNQNYVIPADVDASEYGSVVIWCELFDVLFSPAVLNAH
ncbi:MAG: DM13 domain-containing protein [Pseudomonadota bacterium]